MPDENQRVECLADAVRFMRQHHTLHPKAVVERFPTSLRYPQATIFSYQFFNTDGRNVGVYIPAINSVTSFDHGREYHCWQFNEQESIDWVE